MQMEGFFGERHTSSGYEKTIFFLYTFWGSSKESEEIQQIASNPELWGNCKLGLIKFTHDFVQSFMLMVFMLTSLGYKSVKVIYT